MAGDFTEAMISADVADHPVPRTDRVSLISVAEIQAFHGPAERQRLVANLIDPAARPDEPLSLGAYSRGDWRDRLDLLELVRRGRPILFRIECANCFEQCLFAEGLNGAGLNLVEPPAQVVECIRRHAPGICGGLDSMHL